MQIDLFQFNKLYKSNSEAKGTPIKDNKTASKHRRKLSGKTISQIDKEFYDYIFELINTAVQYTPQERNEIVTDVSEYYWQQTGYTLPNAMCTALSDFLLDDNLANPDSAKAYNSDVNILSWRQIDRRNKREHSMEVNNLDYFSNVERYGKTGKRHTTEKSIND